MTHPPSTSTRRDGIDIRDALSILSARAKDGDDIVLTDTSVPDELKEMGQTIDISNAVGPGRARNNVGDGGGGGVSPSPSSSPIDEEGDRKHEAMKRERARRGEEIQLKLQSTGVVDLLGMTFRAQQDRVSTYKVFDEGLSKILASDSMPDYPTLCAEVTASFSVLSDTINAIKSSLDQQHQRRDIADAVAQLQKSEGEKLNLTAALHLERLRLRNLQLENAASEGSGGSDERTAKLLRDGIQSLERRISGVVESINEVLEELRCIAADENE